MSLSGSIVCNLRMILTGTSTGFSTPTDDVSITNTLTLTNGTGANQAQNIYAATRSLNASSNEDLDLAASLANGLGSTITFGAVKALYVKAASTNGSTLTVKCPASNGVTGWVVAAGDGVKLRPGGILLLVAPDATGYAVTAGTGDLINIVNDDSGAAASYDIAIIGE
jgi:hypothetical protein